MKKINKLGRNHSNISITGQSDLSIGIGTSALKSSVDNNNSIINDHFYSSSAQKISENYFRKKINIDFFFNQKFNIWHI